MWDRKDNAGATPHPLVKCLLLLGLGLYFLSLSVGGNLHNYVNARFAWLPVLAAALFFLLALDGIVRALRGRRQHVHDGPHVPDDQHASGQHVHHGEGWMDHIHLQPSWTVLAIAAIPLLLGTVVPSQPLGAQAVGGELSVDPSSFEGAPVLATDSVQWTVLDWLRAFSTGGPPERISGKEADVIGFVYRREDDPKESFVVMRFLMSCCSADAYAVGMPVMWTNAEALPIDSWVRVRGTVNVGAFRGQTLPILTAASVEQNIERPKQAYLYQ